MDEFDKSLLKEYKEYIIKNDLIISDKQSNYINSLIESIDETYKEKIKEEILIVKFGGLDKITKVIINKNLKLDDNDIFSLIELLKKYVSASFSQLLSVFNIYTKNDIERILKLDHKDKLFISIKDAEFLLGGPDKFKPWIKEHPIICEDEWEYGWQESDLCQDGKLYYLKFYNMMMIDIDINKQNNNKSNNEDNSCNNKSNKSNSSNNQDNKSNSSNNQDNKSNSSNNQDNKSNNEKQIKQELISLLKKMKTLHFRIYKTYNGYHVFITSQLIKYNDPKVMEITRLLNGDLFYAMFSNKTGFKVRLTKKLNRLEVKVSNYIGEVGMCKEDETCKRLMFIHDKYNIN